MGSAENASSAPSRCWLAAFAVVALLLTLAYGTVNAPYEAPDEPLQFCRAVFVATGKFLCERRMGPKGEVWVGADLPVSLVRAEHTWGGDIHGQHSKRVPPGHWRAAWAVQPLEPDKLFFMPAPNTASYSWLSYTGPALAIRLGLFVEARPLVLLYAARLGGALVWVALVTAALALAPVCRWLFALLALTPMALYQASAVTADSWNHGCLLLAVAILLRTAWQPGPLSRKECVGVLLSLAAAGFSRQTFVPLALLALLVPAQRFAGRGQQWAFYALAGAVALLPSLLWTVLNRHNVVPVGLEADPARNLEFLLAHPFHVLTLLPQTIATQGVRLGSEFVGCFGWLDTTLPRWLVLHCLGAIGVMTFFRARSEPTMPLWWRPLLVACSLAVALLTSTAIWVLCTLPSSPLVEGMQGRYFTAIAPLLLLGLAARRFAVPERFLASLVLIWGLSVNGYTLTILHARFWGP